MENSNGHFGPYGGRFVPEALIGALDELEAETVQWAREMLRHSPMALRLLKASMNAADDGLAGVQQLAGDATLLFYLTEEGQEGRDAYKEKREPNFAKFPRRP